MTGYLPDAVTKNALNKKIKRLYFLRQLKKFGLRRVILVQCYHSSYCHSIGSMFAFSIMCVVRWHQPAQEPEEHA